MIFEMIYGFLKWYLGLGFGYGVFEVGLGFIIVLFMDV